MKSSFTQCSYWCSVQLFELCTFYHSSSEHLLQQISETTDILISALSGMLSTGSVQKMVQSIKLAQAGGKG